MKLFDYAYFIGMKGNLIPVEDHMETEKTRQDKIVFNISNPVLTETYLGKSRKLFEKQTEPSDFDQFNVDRIMVEIEQA